MRVTQKSKTPGEGRQLDAKVVFQRLKSDSLPEKRSAVEELSKEPRARDRTSAMSLIKEVTARGDDGLTEIRAIMNLTTEPALGIAALDVLQKICRAREYWYGPGAFLGDMFPLVEASSAASSAAHEAVAMEGLKRLVGRRHLCVQGGICGPPRDEAERKLRSIALHGRHLSIALEALANMRLYEDTGEADLRELERHSVHPEIRDRARAMMESRAGQKADA